MPIRTFDEFLMLTSGKRFDLPRDAMAKIRDTLTTPPQMTARSVSQVVDKNLHAIISGREPKLGLLAGGGLDSTYLLAKLHRHNVNFEVFSAKTRSNHQDLSKLESLCHRLGITHHIIEAKSAALEKEVERFEGTFGRLPNDPAAPLVQMLVCSALERGCERCIDGQFADTVLFANPQNLALKWLRHVPGIAVKKYVSNSHELRSKLRYFQLLASDRVARMLFLSRIIYAQDVYDYLCSLVRRYDYELVFQLLFWFGLMEMRERDKYRLQEGLVVSPFDDLSIVFECVKQNRRGYSQKQFLREYVAKTFGPEALPSASRSFEGQ